VTEPVSLSENFLAKTKVFLQRKGVVKILAEKRVSFLQVFAHACMHENGSSLGAVVLGKRKQPLIIQSERYTISANQFWGNFEKGDKMKKKPIKLLTLLLVVSICVLVYAAKEVRWAG
jgi:hypothetical protein